MEGTLQLLNDEENNIPLQVSILILVEGTLQLAKYFPNLANNRQFLLLYDTCEGFGSPEVEWG